MIAHSLELYKRNLFHIRLKRFPLTITLFIVILITAIITKAITSKSSPTTIERWGFSLDNLQRGRILSVFTSDLLVVDLRHLLSVLAMLVIFVAPVEWLMGSGLTAIAFWPGSIIGSTIAAFIIKLLEAFNRWSFQPDLVTHADVGASVAEWSAAGALAVVIGVTHSRFAWPLRFVLVAFLVLRLIIVGDSADIAHAIGFCLGIGIARTWRVAHPDAQASFKEGQ